MATPNRFTNTPLEDVTDVTEVKSKFDTKKIKQEHGYGA
jgi:hypothetical protein